MMTYLLAVIGPLGTLSPAAAGLAALTFGLCLCGAVYFGVGLLRGKK